jgi:hypothetical protein
MMFAPFLIEFGWVEWFVARPAFPTPPCCGFLRQQGRPPVQRKALKRVAIAADVILFMPKFERAPGLACFIAFILVQYVARCRDDRRSLSAGIDASINSEISFKFGMIICVF